MADEDRTFRLDHRALARVGSLVGGRLLALSPEAWGGLFTLPAAVPTIARLGASAIGRMLEDDSTDDDSSTDDDEETLAIVSISGPLAQRAERLCGYVDGYDAITDRVCEAIADPSVGAVVLSIDSPGGDCAGLEEAVARMRAAVVASGKPVVAYVDELAASAAYWLACGVADSIVVPASGGVGSIGVFCAHVDQSAALEKEGLRVTLVQEPPGKTAGHSSQPLDDEGKNRLRESVSAAAARFFGAVGESRGIGAQAVKDLDGRVVRGADAVRARLADKVGSLEDAVALAVSAKEAVGMSSMKRMLAQLAGAPESASDEQLERTAMAARPLLELGRAALLITGEKDAERAIAKLSRLGDVNARLEQVEQRQAEDEKRERLAAVAGLVASGRYLPADVWTDPAAGAKVENISQDFAGVSTTTLRALTTKGRPVAAVTGSSRVDYSTTPNLATAPPDILMSELTAHEVALAKRLSGTKGLSLERMAKYKRLRIEREREAERAVFGGAS